MSDGFDFGTPPAPRREARKFEPPPWEQEAFDRHRREQEELERAAREDEQQAREELAARLEEMGAATAAPEVPKLAEPEAGATNELGRTQAAQGEGQASSEMEGGQAKPVLDERQVEQMMFELQAEEPKAFEQVWMVIVGSGVIVGLIGIVMVVWGAVALTKVGGPAGFGGTVLVLFGIAFAGIGGWLIYTGLRRRGVL